MLAGFALTGRSTFFFNPLAVVVTGNHYLFDIAAGMVVTAIGYTITRPIRRRPGVEPLMSASRLRAAGSVGRRL